MIFSENRFPSPDQVEDKLFGIILWHRPEGIVRRHFCRNTSTPGKGLPSSHSRKAPPAVET
jgi:hypothetical protein